MRGSQADGLALAHEPAFAHIVLQNGDLCHVKRLGGRASLFGFIVVAPSGQIAQTLSRPSQGIWQTNGLNHFVPNDGLVDPYNGDVVQELWVDIVGMFDNLLDVHKLFGSLEFRGVLLARSHLPHFGGSIVDTMCGR